MVNFKEFLKSFPNNDLLVNSILEGYENLFEPDKDNLIIEIKKQENDDGFNIDYIIIAYIKNKNFYNVHDEIFDKTMNHYGIPEIFSNISPNEIVGYALLTKKHDNTYYSMWSRVRKNIQKQGVLTKMYDYFEKTTNSKLVPATYQSDPGIAFWNKRQNLLENISENPSFKQWFKNSKAIDSKGNPLILYHGTDKDFNEFNHKTTTTAKYFGDGIYFTDATYQAEAYVKDKAGANIIPVYLSLQNPFIEGESSFNNGIPLIATNLRPDLIKKSYQKQGFDGIILKRGWFIAFSPNQVKSVYSTEFNENSNNLI